MAKKKVCWILGVTNWRDIGKNVSNLCLKECESILDSFLKVRYWTCISIKYKRLSFSKGASKELFSQSFFVQVHHNVF